MSTQNPPQLCRHQLLYGENAELPEEAYWDHFCNCLDDQRRRATLDSMRKATAWGLTCQALDHPGRLADLQRTSRALLRIVEDFHDWVDQRVLDTTDTQPTLNGVYELVHEELMRLVASHK